ncbi:MAG: hypothetical protein A3K19_09275 [Lentisphaerae bacterium RIFOXYB12_FULL_65_16]|nr:MAG: hypothetical protein A3K18_14605 [Lentisphaerae bacterium RIFOXYA12_64_32]OGV90377.1 MAG: hypothetical protein A3K19_09275 [Lentisphaerae bacterium RIFOXYB12_FULL_65_16]
MPTSGTINSPTAFSAYTDYSLASLNLNSVMRRLAQGTKSVVDDGAGVAISERMRSQAGSSNMAMHNTENAVSLLQTADTWMQQISDHLARMHELAVDAADGTKTSTDKANIQTEFGALQAEVLRISSNAAKFNGQNLLDRTFDSTVAVIVQVGADSGQTIGIALANLTDTGSAAIGTNSVRWSALLTDAAVNYYSAGGLGSTAGAEGTSVTTQANIAIARLQSAIDYIAQTRASIGAQQGRFEKTRGALIAYENQIRGAENKVRSIDTAREAADLMKFQILNQIATAMMAQGNQLPASAVQLVGGR